MDMMNFHAGRRGLWPRRSANERDVSASLISRRRWVRAACYAVTLLLAGDFIAAEAADAVSQKSTGRTVSGDVTEITKDGVTVKALSKTVEIPANDISFIKWSDEPPKLTVVRSDQRGGRYDAAIKGYEEALKSIDSPAPGLKTDLEYGIAYCTAQLALQSTGQEADAIARLEDFQKANPNSYHYYPSLDLIGRLSVKKQDWERAESSFAELEKSSLPEYKMTARIGRGNLLLARNGGDPAAAAAEFDAVIAMDAPSAAEKSKQLEALLGKATCLIQEKKYPEALGLLDRIVTDVTITDEAVLAEAYNQQGKCHIAAGEPKLAILSFLHVDTLLFKAQAAHAEALYNLAQLWPQVGKPGRGDNDRTRLESLYPDSRWAKQLNGK